MSLRFGWSDPERGTSLTSVVFSKDRPLQLDATLSSLARHCTDHDLLGPVVLYTSSSAYLEALYGDVRASYPSVKFRRERRFKADVCDLALSASHLTFIVDDTVFVRDFRISTALFELEADDQALGFSLRLGTNTSYCYPLNAPQQLPAFMRLPSGTLSYQWPGASHDFGYPLELSSSVYRSRDLLPLLRSLQYNNPNTLEAQLAAKAGMFAGRRPRLLCFERSAAFSVPANLVQDVSPNRISKLSNQSASDLATAFERGGRIEVARYDDFPNNACHQDVQLYIIEPDPPPPAVSVVIPCFQQSQYLSESVGSVVGQTWTDWEIVMVDDGSTDATVDTALGLIRAHPDCRIRLVRQANEGLASARNNGIAASAGRYILPLDADDRLAPTMLERTVAVLDSDPNVAIVYTDVERFGEASGVIRAADFDPDAILEANQLNYCSLFRRGVWVAAGGYNPNMTRGYEDWDFWISCVEQGYVARRIPEPLFMYRVRARGMFANAQAHDAHLRRQIRLNHPRLYNFRSRLKRRVRFKVQSWDRKLPRFSAGIKS